VERAEPLPAPEGPPLPFGEDRHWPRTAQVLGHERDIIGQDETWVRSWHSRIRLKYAEKRIQRGAVPVRGCAA
jgi:hypothetical protein